MTAWLRLSVCAAPTTMLLPLLLCSNVLGIVQHPPYHHLLKAILCGSECCQIGAAGDISEVEATPRRSRHAPERFTVDSYDGRSKDIRKYHRSETLVQNVDTLSLRNRTVLTPSPAEV